MKYRVRFIVLGVQQFRVFNTYDKALAFRQYMKTLSEVTFVSQVEEV